LHFSQKPGWKLKTSFDQLVTMMTDAGLEQAGRE